MGLILAFVHRPIDFLNLDDLVKKDLIILDLEAMTDEMSRQELEFFCMLILYKIVNFILFTKNYNEWASLQNSRK